MVGEIKLINNIIAKAKNIIYKNGQTVEKALDDKVSKTIYSSWPQLQAEPWLINDGMSSELGFAPNRVYLLTIANSHNEGCVYVLQTGSSKSKCVVTQLVGSTSYFTVTPVSMTNATIKATGAKGYISVMCIGGFD